MNPIDLRILSVLHYGSTESENMKVTLSANLIKMVTSKDGFIQNRSIKEVSVYFLDEAPPIGLNLNEIDTLAVEAAVGAYGFVEG